MTKIMMTVSLLDSENIKISHIFHLLTLISSEELNSIILLLCYHAYLTDCLESDPAPVTEHQNKLLTNTVSVEFFFKVYDN